MTKALIHNLGKSLSFGRLSLKAKVLWPMLLASSDDQGRGLAESDAIKWYVCPNVPEIAPDDVDTLLMEMVDQGMILLFECERGWIYQVVRWWEYQQLQWARPSKYDAPEGWTDRIRFSNRGDYHEIGWDTTGGLSAQDRPKPGRKQGRKQPSEPPLPKVDAQPNLTESNSTQSNPIQLNPTEDQEPGATAPPADAGTPPPILSTFPEWQEHVKTSRGEIGGCQAAIRRMIDALYPGLDPPSFAYIAKTAGRIGGFGRLADLLWQHSTRPPTGDLLAYIQGVAKRGNGRNSQDSLDITLQVVQELEEEERAKHTTATR